MGDTLWGVKESLIDKANNSAITTQDQVVQAQTSIVNTIQHIVDMDVDQCVDAQRVLSRRVSEIESLGLQNLQ
jgi:hypothetical protein